MNKSITVFTSTYNRADLLPTLYASLQKQTNKDFEWLIIDDGSVDNTYEIVKEWRKKTDFQIRFFRVDKNRGIAYAMNRGIELANGRLFFKVDSDDMLDEDAIESILYFESTIDEAEKELFAGVSGLKYYENGKAVGDTWNCKKEYIDATNFERRKYNLRGDKAEAYYLCVLKRFGIFPIIEDENYAFEGILWDRVANAGLRIRWFNKKIYKCEYLPDGETNNYFLNCCKNFNAYSYWLNQYIHFKAPFYDRFWAAAKYYAVKFHINRKSDILKDEDIRWIWMAKIFGFVICHLRKLLKPNKYGKTIKNNG